MSRIPFSIGLLPGALAFYLIQTIPTMGTLLLLVGGIFWAGLMVNAAFLGIGAEVFFRRLHKAWLLLPLTWFGIYGGYAWYERYDVATLGAEFDAANAKVRLQFDPLKHALVVEGNGPGVSLLQDYGLPVVYTAAQVDGLTHYRSIRLAEKPFCRTIWNDPDVKAVGIQLTGFHDEVEGEIIGDFEERFCMISIPEAPTLPQMRIVTREQGMAIEVATAKPTETEIVTPDSKRQVLRGGHAEVLPWFPFPVAGCVGHFASDKKGCFIGFQRSNWIPIVDKGSQFSSDEMTLAMALGLNRVPWGERRASDTLAIEELIAKKQEAQIAEDQAQLRRIFADPMAKIDAVPFQMLKKRPEMITPHARDIALAFAATITKDYQGQNNGRNLSRILADLPEGEFQAVRPIIEKAYREDRSPWMASGTMKLRARIEGNDTTGLD